MKKIFIKKKIFFENRFPFNNINKSFFFIIDYKLNNFFNNVFLKFLEVNRKEFKVHVLKKGENEKSLSTFKKILKDMLVNDIDRNSIIISIGGGVCGDISGFVSSVFLRGVELIHIPSTLLSQIDSSIGGKNGINYFSKNIIGTFYKPKFIYISLYFIKRLSSFVYLCGFSEIIKISIICNLKLFNYLNKKFYFIKKRKYNVLKYIVKKSIKLKLNIIKSDLKERIGKRIKLNFGHTFAHALERYFNYELSHGEAIWYGIIFTIYYSLYLKYTKFTKVYPVLDILYKYKCLNLKKISKIKFKKVRKYIFLDKKNINNKIKFVFFNKVGSVSVKKINYFNIKRIFFDFKKKMFII
ncbi:3-dehydroquinate synthase [Candidatus Vidania fulgoroideae]|nr:3-dehydroquinate synthase [Candidatus Vidania fulgoroideae]